MIGDVSTVRQRWCGIVCTQGSRIQTSMHRLDDEKRSFAGIMLLYASGDRIDMTKTLQAFPIPLTSVDAYATRTLAPTGHAVAV